MLSIKEALELKNILLINEEIEERKKLYVQMVGSLYPSILYDEIIKLQELKTKLRKELLS